MNGAFAITSRMLLLMLNAKVKSLPMQKMTTAHAHVLKPHVSCMSAMEFVINKAHASMHLLQHAVQYTANVSHSQTQQANSLVQHG